MERKEAGKAPRPPKKRYTSPRLVEYGNVSKLTLTGGNTHHDAVAKKIGG